MTKFASIALALALLGFSHVAAAHEYEAGNIDIHHPYAYEVKKHADLTYAFMSISNNGDEDDRLLSATSPIASSIDIMDGDEKVDDVTISEHRNVKFKLDGIHLALHGIKHPIRAGAKRPITLHFEHAGDVKALLLFAPLGEVSMCDDGHHAKKIKPKDAE